MSNTSIERIAGLLDERELAHGLRREGWVCTMGEDVEPLDKIGGMDITASGTGMHSALVAYHCECETAGGRITANLNAPGATIIVEGQAPKRAPVITLRVNTPDPVIYLNLGELKPQPARPLHLQVTFYNGKNQLLYWGEGASSVETRCVINGEGRAIVVKRDAMLSNGVYLRTHDGHALVDLAEQEILNPGGDIEVHEHVWLGQDALVVGQARIGSGSVVGTKSMAKGDIDKTCVAGGVPAKVLKRNVTWGRLPNNLKLFESELGRIT